MIDTSLRQNAPVALPDQPSGPVARSIAAHALLTALMVVTPLMVFVPAALFHCGLRNGRRAAWLTAILALVPYAAVILISPAPKPDPATSGWLTIAIMGLAIMLPSLAVLPLIERGRNFALVLVVLLIGSMAGLFATEAISRATLNHSPYAAQIADYTQVHGTLLAEYEKRGAGAEWIRAVKQGGKFTLFVLPGLMLMMVSTVFVLSLLMLGRLNAWRAIAARRTDETAGAYFFRNFSLPDWVLFAFILGGLTPVVGGLLQKITANTLAVVVFLYMLQGLAIFRFLLGATGAGVIQTIFGWSLLVALSLLTAGAPMLLLSVAGLFDSFFDFRHFKKRKDDSHESHSD